MCEIKDCDEEEAKKADEKREYDFSITWNNE
jgi:hypothetical protein